MGTAFVAVEGQHGNNAERFYKMFPAEPVLPDPQVLQLPDVVRVRTPALEPLLRAIAAKGDREIVVISHGSDTQLALRVIPGVNIGLDTNTINALLGTDTDAQLARRLRTQTRHVATLRNRIRQVQQLRLTRLEFRACRVGQSPTTLQALQRLFGASSACGPLAFDGYGPVSNVRPTADAAALARWQASHPQHQTHGSAPNRFFWVNNGAMDPPTISAAFAESWDAVRAWAAAKFPSGTQHNFRQGTFYYHMQTNLLPNSRQTHGQRTFQNNFAFPNDPGYRANLVRVQTPPAVQPTRNQAPTRQGLGPVGQHGTRHAALDDVGNGLMSSHGQPRNRAPRPEGVQA